MKMKMKTTHRSLAVLAMAVPLALFTPGSAYAQAHSAAEPPEPPVFHFQGGTPEEFLRAVEKHYNETRTTAMRNAAESLEDDEKREDFIAGLERKLSEEEIDWEIDWLSIADLPRESEFVWVPEIRVPLPFRAGYAYTRAKSGRGRIVIEGKPPMELEIDHQGSMVKKELEKLVGVYNSIGERRPELGELVIEGDMQRPHVVTLAWDAGARPEIKVKAFPIREIDSSEWEYLHRDIDIAMQMTKGEASQGDIEFHSATGLLLARGSDSYVSMVESIVDAHTANARLKQE